VAAAPRTVETAGVIGAGMQAELQIEALALVRPFSRLLVWSRDAATAEAYAARMTARLGKPVVVAETAEALVRQSQVVVTTTPSRAPLIRAEWLHPGLHITAMGSDSNEKNELDPAIVTAADRFVCDRLAQSRVVGELRSAIATGIVGPDHMAGELGAICAGLVPGRYADDEITVCDLTGTGVQDTAIAVHALSVARARGLGQIVVS
jgi:ornithine cyclodeaminase